MFYGQCDHGMPPYAVDREKNGTLTLLGSAWNDEGSGISNTAGDLEISHFAKPEASCALAVTRCRQPVALMPANSSVRRLPQQRE